MRLFDQLLRRISRRKPFLANDRTGNPLSFEAEAAVALVLLEAAHGDEEYVWREHQAILKGLTRAFGLGRREVLDILDRAEVLRPPICRLEDVAKLIRDRFDESQREEIVRLLWNVIECDGIVFEWEEVFGDHVAQAVGVSKSFVRSVRSGSTRRG